MMFGRPQKALAGSEQQVALPAPTGGLNTLSPAMGLPPTDCMMLRNALAAENGLRVRLGSKEHVVGMRGAQDRLVRTLMSYAGRTSAATRLFAATSKGIWDITDSATLSTEFVAGMIFVVGHIIYYGGTWFTVLATSGSPASGVIPLPWLPFTAYVSGNRVLHDGSCYVIAGGGSGTSGATGPTGGGAGIVDGSCTWNNQSADTDIAVSGAGHVSWTPDPSFAELVCAFSSTGGDAGYGVSHAHTTTAGNFLWYADEANGLFLYTESTDTWTAVSSTSITGVDPANLVFVTVFKGFTLFAERGKADVWVLDVNSIAGAATRLGVGYKSIAGGDIVGVWPWTRDGGSGLDDGVVFVTRGGDVLVYQGTDPTDSAAFGNTGVWGVGKVPAGRNLGTSFGGDLLLLTRSGVVSMNTLTSGVIGGETQYQTAKVQALFNGLMTWRGDSRGWSLVLHPEEAALVVTVPQGSDASTTQLAMSMATRSWSELRGLGIYSCASHEGKLYYGTTDGRIYINTGYVDGVTLASPSTYSVIDSRGISSFQNMGTGAQKQCHLIKFYITTPTPATVAVAARYDFDLTELAAVTYDTPTSGPYWDVGTWDGTLVWDGQATAQVGVRGASGCGANMAIAWRCSSIDKTILTGFEVSFSTGGIL